MYKIFAVWLVEKSIDHCFTNISLNIALFDKNNP